MKGTIAIAAISLVSLASAFPLKIAPRYHHDEKVYSTLVLDGDNTYPGKGIYYPGKGTGYQPTATSTYYPTTTYYPTSTYTPGPDYTYTQGPDYTYTPDPDYTYTPGPDYTETASPTWEHDHPTETSTYTYPAEPTYTDSGAIPTEIHPSNTYWVRESAPDTAFGPQTRGLIQRYNGQNNVITISNFEYPESLRGAGKTCTFAFLNGSPSGSKQVDVFTMLGVADKTVTYNTRPSRNIQLGRFDVAYSGEGTVNFGFNPFPCEILAGRKVSLEITPTNDNDYVSYYAKTEGLYVKVA